MLTYLKKELASNPFYVDNKPVQFEVNTSTNQGVFRFDDTKDDPNLLAALKIAISERRGGIVLIDEEQYEAIKKNTTGKVFAAFSPPEKLRAMVPQGRTRQNQQAAAADENHIQSNEPFPGDAPPLAPTTPFVPASGKSKKTE